jgi:lipoate---protein ligase
MADASAFRVIDTGIRGGRANIAFDQALIEARKEGRIPNTIRFLRFRPSALLGRHQLLSHEIRADYCARNGIEIGRRITGGGGLYLDEGQIGWELAFDRASLGFADLDQAARRICEAAAAGIARLGVPASYRPRNDIEVEGRKLGGTGGFFDGNTLFYQGTLLIDFDPAKMTAVLNIPAAKMAKRALAEAGQRIVTLRELMGDATPDLAMLYDALLMGFAEGLGIAPYWDTVTQLEEDLADRLYREEIGTDAFVAQLDAPQEGDDLATASLTRPGGGVRVDIRLEGQRRERIREVLITGDFFVTPPRVVLDLEASLRGIETAEAGDAVDAFFARTAAQFLSLAPRDFRDAVEAALACGRRQRYIDAE